MKRKEKKRLAEFFLRRKRGRRKGFERQEHFQGRKKEEENKRSRRPRAFFSRKCKGWQIKSGERREYSAWGEKKKKRSAGEALKVNPASIWGGGGKMGGLSS